MGLGVAISVYNKVDELATNVEIIRKHWTSHNDALISVCCNDPKSIARVKSLDVNSVVEGEPIPSVPKPNLRRRQFDCIKKSVMACDALYTIHWHADAFATRVEPILEIIDLMELNGVRVAFRGRGFNYRNAKTIYGDVDDHFLIIRRDSRDALDYDPEFNECNVESKLSKFFQDHFRVDECLHYSDMGENIVGTTAADSYYSDNLQHRAMNPFNVDPRRGFIHAQTKDIIREKLLEHGVPREFIKL